MCNMDNFNITEEQKQIKTVDASVPLLEDENLYMKLTSLSGRSDPRDYPIDTDLIALGSH